MQLSNFLRTVLKLDCRQLPRDGGAGPARGRSAPGTARDRCRAASAPPAVPLIPIGLFMLWLGTRARGELRRSSGW